MAISYRTGKLTLAGTFTGGVIAVIITVGAGIIGLAMLAAFFVLSTLATAHKKKQKALLTEAPHPEKRDAWQVLANGGMAGIMALILILIPEMAWIPDLLVVVLAAALASATADTLSSELGTLYGRKFYDIITLKPGEKGQDGVVSLAGILIGIAGSAVIAGIYTWGYGYSYTSFAWYIIAAGTVGNICDSILGAGLERKGRLSNNAVNAISTFIAALTAALLIVI